MPRFVNGDTKIEMEGKRAVNRASEGKVDGANDEDDILKSRQTNHAKSSRNDDNYERAPPRKETTARFDLRVPWER